MSHPRSTEEALRSFIQWKSRGALQSLNQNSPLPEELRQLIVRFQGYTWAATRLSTSPRIFGICALAHRWPVGLAEAEDAILNPDAHMNDEPEVLNHYIIIEILDAQRARANLGMLLGERSWYLLDEHIFTPAPS